MQLEASVCNWSHLANHPCGACTDPTPDLPLNVRYGSLADIRARLRHVRFTPDSGHSSVPVGCPKSAKSGHVTRLWMTEL